MKTRERISESEWNTLASAARAAAERAYAPYSKFRVGAAVLFSGHEIVAGSNVENASYGITTCAERTAVCAAVAAGARALRAVAVYTPTAHLTSPCGSCRQILHEFGPDCEVLLLCDGKDSRVCTLRDLLPLAFGGPS